MILQLIRTYHQHGVNGVLWINGNPMFKTIELPWRQNAPRVSCIPEGVYGLRKRFSRRFDWHFEITGVPGRSAILIHPANNAEIELKGCIAPVLRHTGEGKGASSRTALQRLKDLLYPVLEKETVLILTINKMKNEEDH